MLNIVIYRCSKASYKQEFEEQLHELKRESQTLIELRDKVMKKIKKAEDEQQMKATKEVEDWVSMVQAAETEVEKLIAEVKLVIKKPRSRRFRSAKEMLIGKLRDVISLQNKGNFAVVAEMISPKHQSDKRVCIEVSTVVGSMESTFDEVWSCIKLEEPVTIVGLYGMGGVGKTYLLKEIQKKLLDMPNYSSKVIWVKVSKDLQLERIQDHIGKQIGLSDETWNIKSLEEKASYIFNILSKDKFVLLMDDIWEMIDFHIVGVPFPPNTGNGSKIVITTRSLEICSLMEADMQFKVGCLADAEAWELFRSMVGDATLESQPEVREVVNECHGLPLALVTIGKAMSNEKLSEDEWRNKLQALQRWTSSFSGLDYELRKDVYYSLKLSYDNLEKDIFKSCLLSCCVFPSDYKISKKELIDYWIGEGPLIGRLGAQSQLGHNIIDVLLDACLLEEEDMFYVKFHRLILEMILWITNEVEKEKEKGNSFVRTDAGLTEAPEIENWEGVKRVSVMKNQIKNLVTFPSCPRLETLFLNSNQLEMIDDKIFGSVVHLKLLNLSNNFSLTDLPSGISALVSLQHLDLSRTGIKELPKVLMALVNLRCLNLEYTYKLRMIPRQMISNFSKLQVLRLLKCGSSIQAEDSVLYDDGEFLMEELISLKNIIMLSICLTSFKAFQKYWSSHKLQSGTQSLELQSLQHPKSFQVALAYLNNLRTLCISKCEYLEELKIEFGGDVQNIRESRCFPFLEEVDIEYCSKLQDLTWLILAPNLKRLRISNCIEMEAIINVGKLNEFPETMANLIPFSKLKSLRLDNLPNLRSIYWNALPFPDLIKRDIDGCGKLHMPPHELNKLKESEVVGEEYFQVHDQASLDPSSSSRF
ncbi:hypothetical protein Dsin_004394 [Dipteronia sinensis]|uniref:NB-ARC domain-containing protein n=1 Tax=Dipteronia sinensis TaxID=43782 RepID=A0AAE0B9I3_9ROSI|nr:hypothetical protein Dsin_004394 [Dipteronia sinensis]